MLKFFTYTDLSGKRRLRTYVIIAIASFALLLLLAGGAALWRILEFSPAEIAETPVFAPLAETAIPEAGKNASPNLFRCVVPSIPIGEICIAFGIKGANTFITAGEVSGLTAIVQGAEWIAHGILSNCMVGGMDIDCVEIREMLCSEKKNSFNSTAYFFILERAEQMYGHYLTNFDTFFQKNHFVKSHEPLIPFLGNLGMEELWQALKVPGKKKLSFVSFDGHEVELDLFNEETE